MKLEAVFIVIVVFFVILFVFRMLISKSDQEELEEKNTRDKKYDLVKRLREYVDSGEIFVVQIIENEFLTHTKIEDVKLTAKGEFHLFTESISYETATLPKKKSKKKEGKK